MLLRLRLLWMLMILASAVAAPAREAERQRLQAARAPNVVLVASDSFVSPGGRAGDAVQPRLPETLLSLLCLEAQLGNSILV